MIFDSGSTVLEAAKAVVARKVEIVAVTNDVEIARCSTTAPTSRSTSSAAACARAATRWSAKKCRTTRAPSAPTSSVFGAHAVSETTISETSTEVAAVKRTLMKSANSPPAHRLLEVPPARLHDRLQTSTSSTRSSPTKVRRRRNLNASARPASDGGRKIAVDTGGTRRIRILADDLTGALDTAAVFAGPVPVYIDHPPADRKTPVDRRARHRHARRRAGSLPERLQRALDWLRAGTVAYKKIDSLLRGNTFAETHLDRGQHGSFNLTVFAPAFPAQGRITTEDRQWIARTARAQGVATPLREAFPR